MSTNLSLIAAAGGVHLPMPAWAFGVVTLVVFSALLLVVWMFRHTAKSMIEGGHGGHSGAAGHGHSGGTGQTQHGGQGPTSEGTRH